MGVYVEVRLENGMPLASIEILRAYDQQQPKHSMDYSVPGRFRYKFKSVIKHPTSNLRWHLEDEAEHERTEDVLALLKAVIERIQEVEREMAPDHVYGW